MDPSKQMQEMLLAELRDIHLPAAISWWPPAPGWWAVAVLLSAVLITGGYAARRYWQANRYRREASEELSGIYARWNDDQQTEQYLVGAGRILRQIAVHICGRQAVSSATGEQWMEALASMSTRPVQETLRSALTQAAYQPNPRLNVDQAHQDIVDWLQGVSKKHYLQSRKSGEQPSSPPGQHEVSAHV